MQCRVPCTVQRTPSRPESNLCLPIRRGLFSSASRSAACLGEGQSWARARGARVRVREGRVSVRLRVRERVRAAVRVEVVPLCRLPLGQPALLAADLADERSHAAKLLGTLTLGRLRLLLSLQVPRALEPLTLGEPAGARSRRDRTQSSGAREGRQCEGGRRGRTSRAGGRVQEGRMQ